MHRARRGLLGVRRGRAILQRRRAHVDVYPPQDKLPIVRDKVGYWNGDEKPKAQAFEPQASWINRYEHDDLNHISSATSVGKALLDEIEVAAREHLVPMYGEDAAELLRQSPSAAGDGASFRPGRDASDGPAAPRTVRPVAAPRTVRPVAAPRTVRPVAAPRKVPLLKTRPFTPCPPIRATAGLQQPL